MTREEAKEALSVLKIYDNQWLREAIDMAIEALNTDIVYCYECKYNGNCCQCVDIIDDLLSLNFCGRGERKEVKE